MSKKIYNVLSPVNHDNVRYEVGSTIDLEDTDAAPLLLVNAVVDTGTLAPTGVPTDPAQRQVAIVAAIGKLDPANTDLWLKDGKPSAEAIAAVTGWPVTSAERNTAWTSITPA